MLASTLQQGHRSRCGLTVARFAQDLSSVNFEMDPTAKEELAAAIQAAGDNQLVQGATRVLSVLQKHGYLQKVKVSPDCVGTHAANRDGLGLNVRDVAELIGAISQVGFDGDLPQPIAVEVPSHDMSIYWFNKTMWEQSGGFLPPMDMHKMKYASVASSHTNAALRCILHGSPGDETLHEDLMVAGKLSLEMVRRKDKAFAEAAETGLTWKVISCHAVEAFPELPALLQTAANCAGHIAKPEHEVQMMRRIYNSIINAGKNGKPCSFSEMKAMILRSRPQCGASAPFMHRFLMKFSVGAHGLWDRVEQSIKALASSGYQVGPDFFESLASDPKPVTSDPVIYWRHAIMVAAYICTVPKLIMAGDVKRSLNKESREKVEQANSLIWECFDLIEKDGVLTYAIRVAFAKFEVDMVLTVLNKRHTSLVVSSSPQEACCKLMDSVESICEKRLSNSWDGHRSMDDDSHAASAAGSDMYLNCL